MSKADILVLAASLGRSLYIKWLAKRLIAGMALLIVLVIVTGIITSVLIIGCIYLLYLLLHDYYASGIAAMALTIALTFAITVALAIITLLQLRRVQQVPHKEIHKRLPLASDAEDVVKAFMNGFQKSA